MARQGDLTGSGEQSWLDWMLSFFYADEPIDEEDDEEAAMSPATWRDEPVDPGQELTEHDDAAPSEQGHVVHECSVEDEAARELSERASSAPERELVGAAQQDEARSTDGSCTAAAGVLTAAERDDVDSSESAADQGDDGCSGIEVKSTPDDRGLGTFALGEYAPSERIMCEAPLLRCDESEERISSERLVAMIAEMSPRAAADFFALSSTAADKRDPMGIWVTNALPTSSDDVPSSSVFRKVSRINHACAPNAAHGWCHTLQRIIVHAVKPILPGEEITINYTGYHAAVRDVRQFELLRHGFECGCALCALPTEQLAHSERRRARISAVSEQLMEERSLGARRRGARSYKQCALLLDEGESQDLNLA